MWPVEVWVSITNTNLHICFLLKLLSCELGDHFASHAWSLVTGARKAAVAGANVLNCVVLFFFFFFQEALRNGLVATEVLMWFYIGEIIGKRGLIGYNV